MVYVFDMHLLIEIGKTKIHVLTLHNTIFFLKRQELCDSKTSR